MGNTIDDLERRIHILKNSLIGYYSYRKEYYRIDEEIQKAVNNGIISEWDGKKLKELLDE